MKIIKQYLSLIFLIVVSIINTVISLFDNQMMGVGGWFVVCLLIIKIIIVESERKEKLDNPDMKHIKDEIFRLANHLAVKGKGDEAVTLHNIHNNL